MTIVPIWRRFALAAITLCIAGGLFRGQIASGLITRGDDAVRNGDRTAAFRYYKRALSVDAASSRAADRLAFTLAMRREPGDAETCIAVATAALAQLPNDPALLADRGLAEQRLARWPDAERDFGRAGFVAHDARYDHLAGRIAIRLGNMGAAQRFFALALRHDPTFSPARVALARFR